tara:strand:+ start:8526 stop:8855 length:330 start_codon:yes stop_codon:yes gene_type:complete
VILPRSTQKKFIKNTITIYRYTGRQGFFTIPKKWCEECDLLINLVNSIIDERNLRNSTSLKIKPWFIWWFIPFIRFGSFHAPQLVINGKLISAGIVPAKEKILAALNLR